MLRGQDVLVLLKLFDVEPGWTVRSLGDELDLDPAGIHRALKRLSSSGLLDGQHRINRSNAEEFLIHGLKYAFPVSEGGLVRGMPTAWAAPPLSRELAASDDPAPVWPYAEGEVRGVALEPLHENAPIVAAQDPRLAERLTLIDAIRLGPGRVRSVAAELLTADLRQEVPSR